MDKKPSQSIIPSQANLLQDVTLRAKLFLRLMADSRISPWIKLIPVGALAYLISPLDLIPGGLVTLIGAADDAAIVWLGYYAFIEMCPPDVVRELAKQLVSNTAVVEEVKKTGQDDVVDGEATDIPE